MEQLLLFDIDGTLLTAPGAGIAALHRAFIESFREELGHDPPWPEVHLHGSTDSQIIRDLLEHAGLPASPERIDRFFASYPPHLERELATMPPERGRLLPGVTTLLEFLRTEGSRRLSLLTGNVQTAAWMKLRRFGIDSYFIPGAFGDDHHDRNQLGPVAMARASSHTGRPVPPSDTIVIGDTPRDIACARACGARVLAVATGAYRREELAAHAPTFLFDDLSDTAAVIAAFQSIAT
jgi:phosphoglycolate phosphatase-like HAD superfamily hydrolase